MENGLKGPKSEGHFKEYPYFEPDLLLKSNKRSWFLIRITPPPDDLWMPEDMYPLLDVRNNSSIPKENPQWKRVYIPQTKTALIRKESHKRCITIE